MKYNDKNTSLSKKSIRIPDITSTKPKSIHKEHNDSNDYGTDNKRSHQYHLQLQQLKTIMASCNTCMSQISDFNTKKPHHKVDRSTQTTQKTVLIDLIEEKVQEICQKNNQLTKTLIEKEGELVERNQEVVDMEDKFTNILYTLGQDYSQLKIITNDLNSLNDNLQTDTQTPSYIKALIYDRL